MILRQSIEDVKQNVVIKNSVFWNESKFLLILRNAVKKHIFAGVQICQFWGVELYF